MSLIHRLQVGVEVGDRVIVEFMIPRGKLTYEGEIGQISSGYVQRVKNVVTPVLFVPVSYTAIIGGPVPGGPVPIDVLIEHSPRATIRPCRNMWNDPKWNIPEVGHHDDSDGNKEEGSNNHED